MNLNHPLRGRQLGTRTSGYIRQAQLLAEVVPISSATLWRWVASGNFPAPVKLAPRVTAWRIEDVDAWSASRAA